MLPDAPQLIDRPITKHSLAINEALIHGTEVAAVVRHRAVIPEHIIRIRGHRYFRKGSGIRVFGGNVTLIKSPAIHIDLPAINADAISGHANYALDVALRRIVRIAKNDNVATLDGL